MQVALYARVSTRDKRQDTENQLAQLRAFAGSQKWMVVREYVDRATGKHSDREQFQRLFEDASRHKFDLVLFWSLDRFSREGVLETLHHLQRLAQYGVGYRSFTEQYLDSCGVFKTRCSASWLRSPGRSASASPNVFMRAWQRHASRAAPAAGRAWL
jgi:DNA invertase Pin-like site-specific DNA recombinase